jgi:hypothetical protein
MSTKNIQYVEKEFTHLMEIKVTYQLVSSLSGYMARTTQKAFSSSGVF